MNSRPFVSSLRALLLLLGLAAAVHSGRAQAEPKGKPVTIGAIYNLTGSQASLGRPSFNGSTLAVEQLNAHGGLLGRRVELVAVDGRSDPARISKETKKLVRIPQMSAITGLSDTNMVLAAAPITEKARMVFLTSGATSPRVPIEFPNYYFMACFGDNTQAAAGAEYAFSTLGAKTAYLLFDETTDYTVLLAGYFKERYQQLGGQIVAEPDTYVGGATDFSAQIAKIKALATPPDMLYVSSGPDEIGTLVKQLREAGIDEPVFGGDGYDTPLLLQTAGDAANDVYFTTHALFDPTQATQRQKEFIDAYQTRFGTPPESAFAGLGYDAVKLLAAAIEHGSAKQKAIPGALEATQDFPGVTGDISFAPGVHIPEKQVTVVHVQGGALTLAAILAPQEVPPP